MSFLFFLVTLFGGWWGFPWGPVRTIESFVINAGDQESTTVAGIYDGDELIAHWRLSSILHTADELGIYLLNLLNTKNIKPSDIHGAAFASVVPSLDFSMTEAIKAYFNVKPLQEIGRAHV